MVGPVEVVSIEPGGQSLERRDFHGSMLNPSPRAGVRQGYDSAMYDKYASSGSYDPELNVALGVSAESPLLLEPHSSVVSSLSLREPGARPQLRTAAILTVLAEPAPIGSFRPPYCGADKTPRFTIEDLDRSLLESLEPVVGTPHLREVEGWFERPWIDHVPGWTGRYIHPRDNMPDYGREIADQVGIAALMLHMDFPLADKEQLLIRFVQLGIDLNGIVQDGGVRVWPPAGGHHSGRKWPILFAGLMLGDPEMSAIGFDERVLFGEDGQTFFVEESSPGVINGGHGGYREADLGKADWGQFHATDPDKDNRRWGQGADPYRTCCTANVWYGQLLAARIMGAQGLWNHDALFAYQDVYYERVTAARMEPTVISWSKFPLRAWKTYREQFD